MTSSDKSIVVGFVSELSAKAGYGIGGEKPLAIIAVLKINTLWYCGRAYMPRKIV